MNPEYVKGVRRFASAGRLRDENGDAFNISHADDIDASEIRSDGKGNILHSPLIWRKPCFGRPERFLRAQIGVRKWVDGSGDERLNISPCNRCAQDSPGVNEACGKVVDERIQSDAVIERNAEAWLSACGSDFGPRCFVGSRARLWEAFWQAIIDHGGWSNVNDDQVKIEALRLKEAERKKRNAAARAARQRQRNVRRGTPAALTATYLKALEDERDQRAEHLKRLRQLSGKTARDMLWLKNLPDSSCDRIADVWQVRELLTRGGSKVTGTAIAEWMVKQRRNYGRTVQSLTTRVCEDLKRISKLEDSSAGPPIWSRWVYSSS